MAGRFFPMVRRHNQIVGDIMNKNNSSLDARMSSLWVANRYPAFRKPILAMAITLFLGSFFLGALALAVYSGFDANIAFPGRLLEYCAGSAWRCLALFGWQAPWWFWLRAVQVLPSPLVVLVTIWGFNHKQWKIGWWGYSFHFFTSGGTVTLFGETLIMVGLPTRFGGLVILLDTCLLIFMLSLAFWNRDLLERFGGLEKVSKRVSGVGIGILAVLGVAFGRMAAENGDNLFMLIGGIIFTPYLIMVVGREWSQTLWRLSPWRVEAELGQMSTKQGNDDER